MTKEGSQTQRADVEVDGARGPRAKAPRRVGALRQAEAQRLAARSGKSAALAVPAPAPGTWLLQVVDSTGQLVAKTTCRVEQLDPGGVRRVRCENDAGWHGDEGQVQSGAEFAPCLGAVDACQRTCRGSRRSLPSIGLSALQTFARALRY